MTVMTGARAYEVDGAASDALHFVQAACDPQRSVVVEACAGSGKTWLLVARMLRLLLDGADASELLAITFTRKAAQEMRERLLQLLRQLALAPREQALALLAERGIPPEDCAAALPAARSLYGSVLASPHGLSVDTFHSWFARLIQIAPLAAGVPHGYALAESAGELQLEAYRRFMRELNRPERHAARQALMRLYEMVGDWQGKKLLDAFIDKRAEWWAATQQAAGFPLQRLEQLCGEDGRSDARLGLWQDKALCARIMAIAHLLGQGTASNQQRAREIEAAMTAGAGIDCFDALCNAFLDAKGKHRKNTKTAALSAAIEAHCGEGGQAWFDAEFEAVGDALLHLRRRCQESRVLALNAALFEAGQVLLECYEAVKTERRVFDFSDLEWHAYRLLADEDHAAYLQSRLDARYRHILLDEFQDTNPLQWCIVRAWLNAYGDDGHKPSVFIVGDPKQSIYRFRRAEPRVFSAARDLLHEGGAVLLRTSQTRRNARRIVTALNDCFAGNALYQPQTTVGEDGGEIWRLPLVQLAVPARAKGQVPVMSMRDPMNEPRVDEEDARRLDEGRGIAHAILQARQHLQQRDGRLPPWSDVMLLVKKRTYLTAYQSALREAGIPFVSGRRGGLLQSLEVSDLIALLHFLATPADNRALAHALKSPLFSASDEDLVQLAERKEGSWWTRLRQLPPQACSAPLRRARDLLAAWMEKAPCLPVHDLLDTILHAGEVMARYASASTPTLRSQTIGNIEAFVELALNLDAGRFPSLPKFIAAMDALRREPDNDAPDEAAVDAGIDAVRILTIHSAKGLEAPIVVLADANHSDPAREDCGILCDWPQDAMAPTHFSCFARKDERGAARDALFEAEEKFRWQEDWNLLYVAATRAKSMLIVSGVAGARGAMPDGCLEGSWYHRLLAVPEKKLETKPAVKPDATHGNIDRDIAASSLQTPLFTISLFDPPRLPVLPARAFSNAAIDEGIALHALLERVTGHEASTWPIDLPDHDRVARWLGCPAPLARTVRAQARRILDTPSLERFFNPACFLEAHNELDVMCAGELLRFDRIVIFDSEAWVLDYKRNLTESERGRYAEQLRRYRHAAQQVYAGLNIRTAVLTADGGFHEL
jgi:ATP-dependent helicase/nuclease subunit A